MKKLLLLLALLASSSSAQNLGPPGGGGGGGGGTPGGTNGQVQFNNSGAFGGETAAIATGCAATGGTIGNTLTGTIATTQASVAHVTTDIIGGTECGELGTFNSGSAVAITLPQAGTGLFVAGWYEDFTNYGAGLVTFTTSTSTFLSAGTPSTYALKQGQGVRFTASTASPGNWEVSNTGVGGSGTVTSITCPSGGTITTSGTCSEDVQTFCPSGCTTTVAGGGSATWTAKNGVVEVLLFGCGGGGQGGGGATGATATAESGGGGGGGADCHWKYFTCQALFSHSPCTSSDTQTVTLGSGGSGSGQGSSTTTGTGASGSNGAPGTSTTFGSFETWFFAGGGQGGHNTAVVSISGGGAGPWGNGATAATTGSLGCTGSITNAGVSGLVGVHQPTCGAPGGGTGVGGTPAGGGYAFTAAPGGEGGGGVSAGTSAISAATSTGGGSMGCITPPAGGSVSATLGTATGGTQAPDFPYHPGCGGGGGAGAIATSVAGNGGAGTAGAGGGGGGSVCSAGGGASCTVAQSAGTGGVGGAGLLMAVSR